MQYFAMSVEEKNEIETTGTKCISMHRVFDGKVFTGKYKWEFDMPEPVKEQVIVEPKIVVTETKPIEENKVEPKRRGNPNWINKRKK